MDGRSDVMFRVVYLSQVFFWAWSMSCHQDSAVVL